MEKPIQVLVELTIEEGKAEDLKMQMPPIIEKVMANEPGMLGYQWYLNQDQTKCYVIEWIKASEAWLAHASNVGSMLPALKPLGEPSSSFIFSRTFTDGFILNRIFVELRKPILS